VTEEQKKPKRRRRARGQQMQLPVRVEVEYQNGRKREFWGLRLTPTQHGLSLSVPATTPGYVATLTIPVANAISVLVEEAPQYFPQPQQAPPVGLGTIAERSYAPFYGPPVTGMAPPLGSPVLMQGDGNISLNPFVARRKLRTATTGDGLPMSETATGEVVAAGFSDSRP
jgi:hypothetical protein